MTKRAVAKRRPTRRPAKKKRTNRSRFWRGDCRVLLFKCEDSSIDACVTDPPYALVSITKRFGNPNYAPAKGNAAFIRASRGFMGVKWDNGDVSHDPEFWREVYRVLKPGAFVLAFGGTRTYHRLACAIEDAGFEVRDMVSWLYGSGFPKSHAVPKGITKRLTGARRVADVRDDWDGWGTALKPGCEPICMARKPLSEKTVAANVLRWGTGAINIDECRVETNSPRPQLVRRKDAALDATRSTYGTGINGSRAIEPTTQGRWPANVIHDGSEEVVAGFSTHISKGDKRGRLNGKRPGGFLNVGAANGSNGPNATVYADSGSAARFFYNAKATKKERLNGNHPTVKPIALLRYLCRLVTPPGGVILDPFAGTGTLAAAARKENFKSLLIEREPKYQKLIARRLKQLSKEHP